MVVLDISVVNVALPAIQLALGFHGDALQWVVNAYALPFAGLLLLGGRLADLYGRKRVFLAGLALFTGASLVGGLADSAGLLVAARAVQGIGAAVLAPATLTVLTSTFPEGIARSRALALWTAVGVAGGTAGNLLGGLLTEFWSWRSILLINVPIGMAAVALAVRSLAGHGRPATPPRLDFLGAVLATTGLIALAYGVDQARSVGWSAPAALVPLGMAVTVLVGFVAIEAKAAVRPLFPLRLFRSRAISVGNVMMLLAGACLNPMWFFLALAMRDVLQYGPVKTGLGFLPHTLVTIAVAAWLTPWLMRYLDSRTLVATGAVLAALGFLLQSRLGVGSDYLRGIFTPAVVFRSEEASSTPRSPRRSPPGSMSRTAAPSPD
ncbi:MFS transporter [Amycolatopsis sp. WAC 04197]|uniref:MFS transporter n=1 Tax=Amycolatopsis sp. WAC 04197 TaxID=2203199 RepID=UPI001F333DC2|nr:MFS transporter [Amycolatopsis sp. WAC 04197]